jgi:ribosomal peptide maturation radical SAM protein 1
VSTGENHRSLLRARRHAGRQALSLQQFLEFEEPSLRSGFVSQAELVMHEHSEVYEPGPATADFRVALVCMPFAKANRPSIQIGLMHAIAEIAGFPTDTHYLNLELAALLGPDLYEKLSDQRGPMTGEWLFARAAFGDPELTDDADYFQAFPGEAQWSRGIGRDPAYLIDLRREVLPRFIEDCFRAVEWGRYRVVGFSSTFQQNVACLALARLIKMSHPSVTIVFGGANMEGEMGPEYARAFPFIDYVVVGEGDLVFPALLRALSAGGFSGSLSGLVARAPEGLIFEHQAAPVATLEGSPTPNYDAYFNRVTQLGLEPEYSRQWILPFESSRGCWWGQKHHCTFCGLNGLGMTFRAKSPRKVLAELSEQTRRYRISSFEAVDNIVDVKYVTNFFSQIETAKTDFRFFYEVKANLTKAQIQALYRGGVRRIQPGIESMSTHVLSLMRKGCTMLQNVRCLKWCRYYNISASWNLLRGFPGETRADYEKQFEVLACIRHLEPPVGAGRIWLERFSPYFFDRDSFPVRDVRPEASYRFVYPSHVNLDKAAYFFDYEMGETVPDDVHRKTQDWISEWQRLWTSDERHTLTYRRTPDCLWIDYYWGHDRRGTYSLSGPLALIYEFCVETMHTVEQVVTLLRSSPDEHGCSADEVRDAMDGFCRARLMLSEEGKYLSLAIPSNPNW